MPRRSTLPADTPPAPAAPPEPGDRISPKKRAIIKEMWLRDGMSPRRIAMETSTQRRAVEAYCLRLGRELIKDIPAELTFEQRFVYARERRLEGISADVARYEREIAALEAERKACADTPERLRLTSLILENRKEASMLRYEWTQTYAMSPPREVLVAEVERVRMELAPPEERPR